MEDLKRLLIVDDSDIDREILKSILEDEFELIEADNGYTALDIISEKEHLDAVLLDISMPILDGLGVLRILKEKKRDDVAVFMITAEATRDNVEKASQYGIAEFIRKPFDREDILHRVRTRLGVLPKADAVQADMTDVEETKRYMSDLQRLYDDYLSASGKDKGRAERMEYFMRTMLKKRISSGKEKNTDSFRLEMLGKAAYLCNMGEMLVPNLSENEKEDNAMYQQHTMFGAQLVRLNFSGGCKEFVQLCSDICLCHHERYDGKGFTQGLCGSSISIYAQMCGLLERFDDLFFNCSNHNPLQFDYVMNQLQRDTGLVSGEVLSLLEACKDDVINYYIINYI